MEQKRITWILIACLIGTVLIGSGILYLTGILRPVMLLESPREIATPEPEVVEQAVSISAEPTPVAQPSAVPTRPAYPSNAVTLLVNGTPLFTLSNRETAEYLMNNYLSACASENLTATEHLIRAYVDAQIAVSIPDSSVEYLTYEAAIARLMANRTLIPVVRTVERAELSTGVVETSVSVRPQLPVGSRLIVSLGKPEHQFGLSETLYKNGIAVSASQTLAMTRVGSDPSACTIENGAYTVSYTGEPTENEGAVGKDAGSLKLTAPCKGKVTSYFGMRNGKMHYGIDYALRAGDPIIAPESGTVIFCGERGTYGYVIEIRHENGFVSRLTHCANASVDLEQHVYRGDPIAVLALDENAGDPHLHYELLIDGIPYNPLRYLP